MVWLTLALLASLAGVGMVYLASPHQRWIAAPWPVAARRAGLLLWIVSLAAWWLAMRPLAAVFAFVTWSMCLFIGLPAMGAWLQARRGRGQAEATRPLERPASQTPAQEMGAP